MGVHRQELVRRELSCFCTTPSLGMLLVDYIFLYGDILFVLF
jgi:hypothetical protein